MEFKGYTFGYGTKPGAYFTEEVIDSFNKCLDLGLNWVCIPVALTQDTFASTEIRFDYKTDLSYIDIEKAVSMAHARNVKVCLKPMVNCADGVWRADINFPDGNMIGVDTYWSKWFKSYTAFILNYAMYAEKLGCEMLCLGCEMLSSERKEKYWRELIAQVKKVYAGKLVYNTNHGSEENAKWVDELDYLGTSAYFRVGESEGATLEGMIEKWEKVADHLEEISKRVGKKIIFMEIGCRSAKGCSAMPWDFAHRDLPRDEQEQADFYESVLKVMSKRDWFEGFFWWDWSTKVYKTKEEADKDVNFNIHLKKAEEVVKKYYSEIQ